MTYSGMALDILHLFAEAQRRRVERPGTIGRLIGRGHWYHELTRLWRAGHQTQVAEYQRLWIASNRERHNLAMRLVNRRYRARLKAKRGA